LLEHGGRLHSAALRFGIPVEKWLDLSTGINPNGWQKAIPPMSSWFRLPEDEDGLLQAAMTYYQSQSLLPIAGSQAAIQALPKLRSKCKVAVLSPSYNEHAYVWQRAGHQVNLIDASQIGSEIDHHDVVVIINPNNPTGINFDPQMLLSWHKRLVSRDGWLLIDEAFIDPTPNLSLALHTGRSGLIVLRSLGKFFGLAGARVGFVLAEKSLLNSLAEELGPWTINTPARWLAIRALRDEAWQQATRERLKQESQKLHRLLTKYSLIPDGSTALFQSITFNNETEKAISLFNHLAQQGILVRHYHDQARLRCGLPANNSHWQRLQQSLITFSQTIH